MQSVLNVYSIFLNSHYKLNSSLSIVRITSAKIHTVQLQCCNTEYWGGGEEKRLFFFCLGFPCFALGGLHMWHPSKLGGLSDAYFVSARTSARETKPDQLPQIRIMFWRLLKSHLSQYKWQPVIRSPSVACYILTLFLCLVIMQLVLPAAKESGAGVPDLLILKLISTISAECYYWLSWRL